MRELLPGEFELDLTNMNDDMDSSEARRVENAATAVHNDNASTTAKRVGHSKFRNYRKSYNGNGYAEAADQVLLAWEMFLAMTLPTDTSTLPCRAKSGSRSLFSMALNSTSSWIYDEQKAIDASDDKDDTTNVADEIFTELEETYSYGNGWKPLKEIVHFHGIHLLCNSIRQRILSPTTIRRLENRANELHAHNAADEIILALCDVTPKIDAPAQVDTHRVLSPPLNILFARRGVDANQSSTWRCLTKLLGRGTIPAEWICTTALTDVVIGALKAVLREAGDSRAAVDLITQIIDSSIDPRDENGSPMSRAKVLVQVTCAARFHLRQKTGRIDAATSNQEADSDDDITNSLNNSIASILKILGTAHVKSMRKSDHLAKSKPFPLSSMQLVVANIISKHQQYSTDRKQQLPKPQILRILYVFLAYHIYMADEQATPVPRQCTTPLKPTASGAGPFHLQFLENFLQPLSQRTKLIKPLASFIINISCDRGMDIESGFAHIKCVAKSFLHINNHKYPTVHAFLGRITVDTALDFASATLIPGHHEWALSVQGEVQGRGVSSMVLTPSLALAGYKWEDGLGEWVAKTPVSAAARAAMLKNARAIQAANGNAEIAGSKCPLPSPNDSGEDSSGEDESDNSSCSEAEGKEEQLDHDGDVEMGGEEIEDPPKDVVSSDSDLDVTPLPQKNIKWNRRIPAPLSTPSSWKRKRTHDASPSVCKEGYEQKDSGNLVSKLFPTPPCKPRRASSLLARQKWHVYIDENPEGDDSSDSFEDTTRKAPSSRRKSFKSNGRRRSGGDSRVLKEKKGVHSNRPARYMTKPTMMAQPRKPVGGVAAAADRRSSGRIRRSRLSISTPANIDDDDDNDELVVDHSLAHEDDNHQRGYRSHVSDSDDSENEDDILVNAPANYSAGRRRNNARRSMPSSSCNGVSVNIVVKQNGAATKTSRVPSTAPPSDAAVDLAGMSEDELSFV